jgi:hypothetical protein
MKTLTQADLTDYVSSNQLTPKESYKGPIRVQENLSKTLMKRSWKIFRKEISCTDE